MNIYALIICVFVTLTLIGTAWSDDRTNGPQIAVLTDNPNSCREDHELIRKFQNNIVLISGKGANAGWHTTHGTLIEGCTTGLTAGHVLYDRFRNPLDSLTVIGRDSKRYKFTIRMVRQGPWRQTGAFKDEVALISFSSPLSRECRSIDVLAEDGGSAHDLVNKLSSWTIHLVQMNERGKLCAQECKIRVPDEGPYVAGTIEHNCATQGGSSGAPIIASKNGQHILIGVHTGPHSATPNANVFAPVNATIFERLR